ncbi:MAG: protease modulator HflC [Clostridia bacterium]|nr:protease modulator HflC [Clostridia bacterium]
MSNVKNQVTADIENAKPQKKGFPWLRVFIAAALVVVIGYFGFTCEVREGTCAVILRFGAPRAEITEAGLYFKLPWPFETVTVYDNRLQYLESNSLETTTKDNRNVILQSYALWSINDPLKFHNSIGSQEKVENYIRDQIFSATNSVLGSYELTSLVSLEKEQIRSDEIQEKIYAAVKNTCEANYGITVNDVSILRISLPDTNLESVFEQMRADRQKDIDTILAEAQKNADMITGSANTKYTEIVSGATIEAAEINAKTEAEVSRIYSEAQSANLELYQFLKELDTIIASVAYDTVLVVTADSYPFNILLNYSDMLEDGDGNETVINDLNYILSQLPEEDRNALIDAIYALIREAGGTQQ